MPDHKGRFTFFASQAEFRTWLERHHATEDELWVGYYKKGSGTQSITWPESVDEALCFGWIDGVRKSIDAERYTIRFTPRKPTSIWSAVNTKRTKELLARGLMHTSGIDAFNRRDKKKTNRYSFERDHVKLPRAFEQRFRKNGKAWKFFQNQPPWYRKTASWWVVSAKQETTQLRRMEILIRDSAAGVPIGPLRRPGGKSTTKG